MSDRKFYIICGHYGSGKSNYTINLALSLAESGRKVLLLDLDLVNPYFLSSKYKNELEAKGVEVIASTFANTNLDAPALPPAMNRVFEEDYDVVMDVGGDDAGSVVLGRFANRINNFDYEMIYIINKYRNLTGTPEEALEVMSEIEAASRCKVTGLINNSHLKAETTWDVINDALDYGTRVAKLTNLPLLGTTIPKSIIDEEVSKKMESTGYEFIPVDIIVKAPWE